MQQIPILIGDCGSSTDVGLGTVIRYMQRWIAHHLHTARTDMGDNVLVALGSIAT